MQTSNTSDQKLEKKLDYYIINQQNKTINLFFNKTDLFRITYYEPIYNNVSSNHSNLSYYSSLKHNKYLDIEFDQSNDLQKDLEFQKSLSKFKLNQWMSVYELSFCKYCLQFFCLKHFNKNQFYREFENRHEFGQQKWELSEREQKDLECVNVSFVEFVLQFPMGQQRVRRTEKNIDKKRIKNFKFIYIDKLVTDYVISKSNLPSCQCGLFSLKKIPNNHYLFNYLGELIQGSEIQSRQDLYQQFKDFYTFEMNKYLIDGFFFGNISRFLNHRGNGYENIYCELSKEIIRCLSRREIYAEEELFFDYGPMFQEQLQDYIELQKKYLSGKQKQKLQYLQ